MLKNDTKRIILTGGHAGSTAYATIEELRKNNNYDWDIYFIGSKNAIEGKNVKTLEVSVFPKMGVKTYSIVSGRLQRKFSRWTIPSLFKIPLGFINALYLILKIKPDVILSFGGFSSFPVVVISFIMRVPVVIHEQTISVGRANKYSSVFAKKIALARNESLSYFPRGKCTVVGNPVSSEISSLKPKKMLGNPPTLFITGGSRGSSILNETIFLSLTKLLSRYKVIHQTGSLEYALAKSMRNNLPEILKKNYEIYPLIEPWNWFNFINRSDLVVSRSGANIVSELISAHKLAILVPLPFSYEDEQTKNAHYAKELGVAEIINQEDLNTELLVKKINEIIKFWEEKIKNIKDPEINDNKASGKLVRLVESVL